MNTQILKNHKFQFISFIKVYHEIEHNMITPGINSDSHLLHITGGEGEITLNNIHKFSLSRGSIVAIPRRTHYLMKLSKKFSMLNVHYQLWLGNGAFMEEKLRLPYFFDSCRFDECEKILLKMNELPEQNTRDILQKSFLAYQIVIQHLSRCELVYLEKKVVDERIDRAVTFLGSKGCHSCDINKVARIACLSKSQLNRKFREAFDLSPHQFWVQQRMQEICLQLKETNKSLAEIAEDFNFSSPYYFSRWFKKNISCSPSTFRNTQANH